MTVKFDPKKTVFILDGSSILYRGYYGVRPLHTAQGVPVGAVYNFCRMIKHLVDLFDPSYLVIVWDSKGKTTRHEMYEAYKATRSAPPADLFEQKEKIVEFADLVGIRQIARAGIEADDLMFSIAQEQVKAGNTAVFVTSDKDMGQAIGEHVLLYDPMKQIIYDTHKFEEKMALPIAKLPFYYALLGDQSDNIPGVRGIGEKTAQQLVNQFDSLEDMYARIFEIKIGRARTALQENKDNAFLSRDLFLLQYYSTGLTHDDLFFDRAKWPQARPLFEALEFKSLLKDLGEKKEEGQSSVDTIIAQLKKYDFKLVTTQSELDELCAKLIEAQEFAFDTETNGLRAMEVDLIGISFSFSEGSAYYVPCGHQTGEPQLPLAVIIEKFKPIFADPTIKKYAHNLKYDQHVLENHGIIVNGCAFDTFIAASLLVKSWQSAGLKNICEYYFGESMLTFEAVVKDNKYKDFSFVPFDLALYYAANDALQTLKFKKLFEVELAKEGLLDVYNRIEFPLIGVLYEMEKVGIYLDLDILKELDREVTAGLVILRRELLNLIGPDGADINFNSPKQMQHLLFTVLQLPTSKKSAKGTGYSTDQAVLSQLAKLHPIPGLILKYRELFKLKTTYIDALPTYVNPKTKRVHTTFNQARVATGRIASSDPNLQNIPVDGTGYGMALREAFKPRSGNVFISADYSQIELRVLAHLSQDIYLKQAFLQGDDIHAQTAAGLFDLLLTEVSHDQRQLGKRINFSILYGLTPYGLSKDLEISLKEAKHYIEKYFAQYPGVCVWTEQIIAFAHQHGYVETFWGRRRDIPAIYEKNKTLYEEAKRVAVNTVAQGTAAEIMKLGMINVERALRQENIKAQILLQIHDELLISVVQEQQEYAQMIIKSTLESVVEWTVPLVVTTRAGANWKEVTK